MENQNEIWKPIPGFEGFYEASNLGRIKSLCRIVNSKQRKTGVNTRLIKERILKKQIHNKGYELATISKMGTNKRFLVHRLVSQTFIPNDENKPCINHLNGIKNDNRIENLEWVTHSENEQHSYTFLGKQINRKKHGHN